MEVYVSVMRVDAALTTKEETDLKGRLSAARQEKIDRLRYAADRRLSLGAGLLLDQGLKRFGLRERTEAFGTVENGKPCLLHHPEIQFNLSHSGSMVMAAFSSCPVGCDVEKKQKARMDVAKRFFAPAEQRALLAAETEEERDILFSRLWTLKESYLKVGGQGMAMALDSFTIALGGQPVLVERKKARYRFQEFSLPDYCASVCVQRRKQGKGRRFFSLFKTWKIWYDTDRV
ncbi:MAG: 4'-phosphopantetheinyl transferase superfamily protein [Lachnospiraceae bacterium]